MAFTLSGDDACQITHPSPIPNPYWVAFSPAAAKLIGLELNSDGLPSDPAWLEVLAGNSLTTNQQQFHKPISTAYSGHQFGVWAGQLGDGRAILLGEMNGQELQLKGAGKTKYSRMGDGRAVLRSSIREFLCSEAMHALGIPTTRALAIVGSELPVRRETIETAAVCTRLAPSFLRVGQFEHYASLQNVVRIKELSDILIKDYYPECQSDAEPYLELFKRICERNAILVAQWFEIDHICNHSDQGGRYAYHRQPQIMHWNMACLASGFLPLLELTHDEQKAQSLLREALESFPVTYAQAWQSLFRRKLGFAVEKEGDIRLIERLLQAMHDSKVDFTHFFRQLGAVRQDQIVQQISLREHFVDRDSIDQWFTDYLIRLKEESSQDRSRKMAMDLINPKYILRNHLAQVAIDKAKQHDFSEINTLLEILSKPYDEQSAHEQYAIPPPPDFEKVEVSCSS